MAKNEMKLNPLKVITENGDTYVLEFSRASVKFAEQRGFDIGELTKFPQTNIPAFWFYAFRKNHQNMARTKTDEILEELGGLTPEELERLVQLYNQPTESLLITEEGGRKNSRMTVEL